MGYHENEKQLEKHSQGRDHTCIFLVGTANPSEHMDLQKEVPTVHGAESAHRPRRGWVKYTETLFLTEQNLNLQGKENQQTPVIKIPLQLKEGNSVQLQPLSLPEGHKKP